MRSGPRSEASAGRACLEGVRPGSLVRVVVLDHYSFEDYEDVAEVIEEPIRLEYIGRIERETPEYLVLVFGRELMGRRRKHEGICLLKSAITEAEVLVDAEDERLGDRGGEGE